MRLTLKSTVLAFLLGIANTALAETDNPSVVMNTNRGSIVLEIYADKSPITAANFLKLVDEDYYDGLIFHRVIKGFMIQGGGFSRDMSQKMAKETILNESSNGVSNATGTISMARTSDPDSASAQFFINTVDNVSLDARAGQPGYAVFGIVTQGMEVVQAIEDSDTGSEAGHQDVPIEKTVIHNIEVL